MYFFHWIWLMVAPEGSWLLEVKVYLCQGR